MSRAAALFSVVFFSVLFSLLFTTDKSLNKPMMFIEFCKSDSLRL